VVSGPLYLAQRVAVVARAEGGEVRYLPVLVFVGAAQQQEGSSRVFGCFRRGAVAAENKRRRRK